MKKKLSFILAFCMVLCTFLLTACALKGEKYNLSSVTGLTGVSTLSYEYSYVELFDDGTYKLENKAKMNGIVTKQTGKYLKKDGTLIISDSDNGNNYFLYTNETITYTETTITVSATISGFGLVTMVFEK